MVQEPIEDIEQRSIDRVLNRMTDMAPCKGDSDVLCPFCDRPMRVRRTVLGNLSAANSDGECPHVDGVQMKCAGEDGCGFRPDFDVPISKEEHDEELEARGQKLIDMGYDPNDGEKVEERLRSLGYIIGQASDNS